MGARQSVVQSTLQSSPPADDHGLVSLFSSNGHTATNEASTSTSSSLGGARPRLILQSTSSSSSGQHRLRQTRSRSMTTTPPQIQADAAALIAALSQQRRRANRLLADAAAGGSSDQSSDSGDDNDAMTASTMRSLDRLLRLNSVTAAGTEGQSSSTGSRIWLPPVSFRYFDIKCPICNKTMPFDDVEYHLVVCLTRPKIAYNEEVLTEDRDECVICFDEMSHGDTIARLPCLCVYHKTCIDGWFKVKNCCPAHPGDD